MLEAAVTVAVALGGFWLFLLVLRLLGGG